MSRKLGWGIFAAVVAAGAMVGGNSPSPVTAAPSAAPVATAQASDYSPQVQIKDFSWRAGGFGSVMVASFKLSSTAPVTISKVLVVCQITAANGTVLGTASEVFHVALSNGGTHAVKDYSMGFIGQQAAKAGCRVEKAVQ